MMVKSQQHRFSAHNRTPTPEFRRAQPSVPRLTGQRISLQTQLADDVLRDVGGDALTGARLAFRPLQQVVKFLWVEFETLEEPGGARDDEEETADQRADLTGRLG